MIGTQCLFFIFQWIVYVDEQIVIDLNIHKHLVCSQHYRLKYNPTEFYFYDDRT